MNNLDDLLKVENELKSQQRKEGVLWQLIKSIHSHPLTRERVAIEAIPVAPYIIDSEDGSIKVISLLAYSVPKTEENVDTYKVSTYIVWNLNKPYDISNIQVLVIDKLSEKRIEVLSKTEFEELSSMNTVNAIEKKYFEEKMSTSVVERFIDTYKEIIAKLQIVKETYNTSEDSINSYLSKLEEIVKATGNEDLSNMIKNRVSTDFYSNKFKVAVIGEFSTGKSTLVNKLIAKDILPMGILPTTAVLTRIKYGTEDRVIKSINGKKEAIDFSRDAINGFMKEIAASQSEASISVEVNDPWLEDSGFELIDTPGAGDIDIEKVRLVYDLASTCEGVIFTISALRALSLSEKTFMVQHILSKKVPHIAVVISRLDQAAEDEREMLIKSLIERLGKINKDIKLFIPQEYSEIGLSETYSDICGLGALKRNLLEWKNDKRNMALKDMQQSNLLLEMLGMTKQYLEMQKKHAIMGSTEREAEYKLLEEKINRNRLAWEDYRLTMESNANKNSVWVREELKNKRSYILEDIILELKSAPNPRIWWVEYYPITLRRRMEPLLKMIENGLLSRIGNDLNWLDSEIKKSYGGSMERPGIKNLTDGESIKSIEHEIGLMDFNTVRIATRAGMALTTIIGYVFFGPFGIAASVGGALVSEIFLNKSINSQKEKLEELIPGEIDKVFDNMYESLRTRLSEVYKGIINNLNTNEMQWLEMERKMLYSEFGTKNSETDEKLKGINLSIISLEEMIARLNQK